MTLASVAIIAIVLLLSPTANCDEEHLLCKRIGEAFATPQCGNVGPEARRLRQGLPGKVGAKGDSGVKGQKGERGSVDYDVIHARIEDKFNAAMVDVNKTIEGKQEQLEKNFNDSTEKFKNFTKEEISDLRAELKREMASFRNELHQIRGICNIVHRGKCFWLVRFGEKLTYPRSLKRCTDAGGMGADVTDRTIYNLLISYARGTFLLEGESYSDFWIGMKYNPQQSKDVFYANGTRSTFLNWHPGTPNPGDDETRILLRFNKDPGSTYQGMHNWRPTSTAPGIACQFA